MCFPKPMKIEVSKGRFTRYNFVACDMLTTSLRHELFRVNQTYNLLAIVVYDTENVVSFWSFSVKHVLKPYDNRSDKQYLISWKTYAIFP